jgi:FkbM family methyltransferase
MLRTRDLNWDCFGLNWRVPHWRECWELGRLCKNWRAVISARRNRTPLDRFELRSGTCLYFPAPPPFWLLVSIWGSEIYTRTYPKHGGDPRVIVDIGANIGAFSLFAAGRWPRARVLAYEPAPENLLWLERNVRANRHDRIEIHPAAVCGATGEVTLWLREGTEAHSLWGDGAHARVPATTLDAIVAEITPDTIDLLKLDCEGAEYDILIGREDLLARHVRFVALEYHEEYGHHVCELTQVLNRAGFRHRVSPPHPRIKAGMLWGWNAAGSLAKRF